MFPYNSPSFLRDEYQARIDAVLQRSEHLDAARWTKREGIWTRLRAWMSTRRQARVERARPVDRKVYR